MRALPPEWSSQSAIMLIWPHAQTAWAPILAKIEAVFLAIIQAVTRFQSVVLVVHNDDVLSAAKAQLENAQISLQQIHFYLIPNNDTWARDCGPITVIDSDTQSPVLLDFTFNGWGQKYPANLDNAITRQLHSNAPFNGLSYVKIPWVLEGGSIENNGAGCLLTTSRCLLDKKRNPHASKTRWEEKFQTLFGIEKVLWLDHGHLAGDDTDAHIDILARFIKPDTILYTHCDDPDDHHFADLQRMAQQLSTFTQTNGQRFQLIPLPWPTPQSLNGRRLAVSYANFLLINQAVLVPLYDDPADKIALQQFEQHLPDREIIGIPCPPLLTQNGSLHCLTMQFPQGIF